MSYRGLSSGNSPAGRSDRGDYDPFRADNPQMLRSKSPGSAQDALRERRGGAHARLYQSNNGGQSSTSLHSMASHLGGSPLSRERTAESDAGNNSMLRGRSSEERRLGDAASVRSAKSPNGMSSVEEGDSEVESMLFLTVCAHSNG